MYRYRFTSGTHEGNSTVTLLHPRKLEKHELHELFKIQLSQAVERIGNTEPLAHAWVAQIENLFDAVIDLLCEKYRFQREEYEAEFYMFGWRHLDNEVFDNDEETNELVEHLARNGMDAWFFKEWQRMLMNTSRGSDDEFFEEDEGIASAREVGTRAGMAFRLHEILGRKAFRTVVASPPVAPELFREAKPDDTEIEIEPPSEE